MSIQLPPFQPQFSTIGEASAPADVARGAAPSLQPAGVWNEGGVPDHRRRAPGNFGEKLFQEAFAALADDALAKILKDCQGKLDRSA